MLEHTYPSKRPKPVTNSIILYPNGGLAQLLQLEQSAKRFNCTVDEYKRRDAIVRELYRTCKYRAGDRVILTDKTIPYTETGDVTVRHIVETYAGMGHEEPWPPSDNPFLVTIAYSANPSSVIRCTTNYVQLEPVSMGVC